MYKKIDKKKGRKKERKKERKKDRWAYIIILAHKSDL